MATPFGKTIKKLRIEKGVRLKDMADSLGCKSSYLSAIESGRKRISEDWLIKISGYFGGNTEHLLRPLVDQSQPDCQIDLRGANDAQRDVVVAFARKFSDLSDSNIEKIKKLLD